LVWGAKRRVVLYRVQGRIGHFVWFVRLTSKTCPMDKIPTFRQPFLRYVQWTKIGQNVRLGRIVINPHVGSDPRCVSALHTKPAFWKEGFLGSRPHSLQLQNVGFDHGGFTASLPTGSPLGDGAIGLTYLTFNLILI